MPLFAEPSPTPARNRPLHGLHVLDLSTVISGPMAVAILADQGAAVIKVETPEGCTSRPRVNSSGCQPAGGGSLAG